MSAMSPGAVAEPVPAPLACLVRSYTGRAELRGSGFVLRLPGGQEVPYDDGHKKTFAEQLARPDVKDAFSQRYVPGPIQPVTQEDQDPGRIRLEPLFAATYGATQATVDITVIPFLGLRLQVHRCAAPAFARVEERLARLLTAQPAQAIVDAFEAEGCYP